MQQNIAILARELLNQLERTEMPVCSRIKPGLSEDIIDEKLKDVPFLVHDDVRTLYMVFNGVDVAGHVRASDIEIYNLQTMYDLDLGVLQARRYFDPANPYYMFPLLLEDSNGFYAVCRPDCTVSSVVSYLKAFDPEPCFSSLENLLTGLVRGYSIGALHRRVYPSSPTDMIAFAEIAMDLEPNLEYWHRKRDAIRQLAP